MGKGRGLAGVIAGAFKYADCNSERFANRSASMLFASTQCRNLLLP